MSKRQLQSKSKAWPCLGVLCQGVVRGIMYLHSGSLVLGQVTGSLQAIQRGQYLHACVTCIRLASHKACTRTNANLKTHSKNSRLSHRSRQLVARASESSEASRSFQARLSHTRQVDACATHAHPVCCCADRRLHLK